MTHRKRNPIVPERSVGFDFASTRSKVVVQTKPIGVTESKESAEACFSVLSDKEMSYVPTSVFVKKYDGENDFEFCFGKDAEEQRDAYDGKGNRYCCLFKQVFAIKEGEFKKQSSTLCNLNFVFENEEPCFPFTDEEGKVKNIRVTFITKQFIGFLCECVVSQYGLEEAKFKENYFPVVTIPANWSLERQQIYFGIFKELGFKKNAYPCSEPESASFYYNLYGPNASKHTDKSSSSSIIVVLENGGSTINTSICTLVCKDGDKDFQTHEYKSYNNPCGNTANIHLLKLVLDSLNKTHASVIKAPLAIDDFRKGSQSSDWFSLVKKISFTKESLCNSANITSKFEATQNGNVEFTIKLDASKTMEGIEKRVQVSFPVSQFVHLIKKDTEELFSAVQSMVAKFRARQEGQSKDFAVQVLATGGNFTNPWIRKTLEEKCNASGIDFYASYAQRDAVIMGACLLRVQSRPWNKNKKKNEQEELPKVEEGDFFGEPQQIQQEEQGEEDNKKKTKDDDDNQLLEDDSKQEEDPKMRPNAEVPAPVVAAPSLDKPVVSTEHTTAAEDEDMFERPLSPVGGEEKESSPLAFDKEDDYYEIPFESPLPEQQKQEEEQAKENKKEKTVTKKKKKGTGKAQKKKKTAPARAASRIFGTDLVTVVYNAKKKSTEYEKVISKTTKYPTPQGKGAPVYEAHVTAQNEKDGCIDVEIIEKCSSGSLFHYGIATVVFPCEFPSGYVLKKNDVVFVYFNVLEDKTLSINCKAERNGIELTDLASDTFHFEITEYVTKYIDSGFDPLDSSCNDAIMEYFYGKNAGVDDPNDLPRVDGKINIVMSSRKKNQSSRQGDKTASPVATTTTSTKKRKREEDNDDEDAGKKRKRAKVSK